MRDKRAIVIKDPRLQKIRNNLRNLIIQAYHIQWKEIHDKWRSYLFNSDGSRRDIDDFSSVELTQFRELQEQENQLSNSLDRSILICVACGKGERDMVYNKAYNAWYCTECYDLEGANARRSQKGTKPKSCEDKALEEYSKTFL